MRPFSLLLSALIPMAVQAETAPPSPTVEDGQIVWPAVDAISINVHRDSGEWLLSLPGDATAWMPDTEGEYFLVATDSGEWTGWGKSQSVSVVNDSDSDVVAAEPNVVNLRAVAYSESALELFWEAPAGARVPRYRIVRDGIDLEHTTGHSFFDDRLSSATEYLYAVVPVYDDGREGTQRLVATRTLGQPERQAGSAHAAENKLPSTVTNLRASVYSSEALELFWGIADDEDGSVSGYTVYRDNVPVATVSGGSFFDNTLHGSTTYSYEVRAVDDTGAVGLPSTISATTSDSADPESEPLPVELPADCLLALGESGSTFCFSPASRELMATNADGSLDWQIALPAEAGINDIRDLLVIGGQLFVLAELNSASGTSGYELSAYDHDGVLQYTVPILSQFEDINIVGHSTRALQLLIDDDALVIIGHYEPTTGERSAMGTFVARVNTLTGLSDAQIQLPNKTVGSTATIADGNVILALDGELALFDAITLGPVSNSMELTFNTDNYRESRVVALSLLKGADFTTIDAKLAETIDNVTPDSFSYPSFYHTDEQRHLFNCPDGGSVSLVASFSSTNYTSQTSRREYTFSDCTVGTNLMTGEYTWVQRNLWQKYISKTATTKTYSDLEVSENETERWSTNASIVEEQMNENLGAVFNRNTTLTTVDIADYEEVHADEVISIDGRYVLGSSSTMDYNFDTDTRVFSNGTFQRYTGSATRVSRQSGQQIDVTVTSQIINDSRSPSPSAGRMTMRSSDGSALTVNANNGDPLTVQYQVSDGFNTTTLDDAW